MKEENSTLGLSRVRRISGICFDSSDDYIITRLNRYDSVSLKLKLKLKRIGKAELKISWGTVSFNVEFNVPLDTV